MKIGILTYHASINYGAFLQAYSFQKYLCSNFSGVDQVEVIDYESFASYKIYMRKMLSDPQKYEQYSRFEADKKQLTLSPQKTISDNLEKVQKFIQSCNYDIIIVGSDEVWRTDSFRGFPNVYWLNFDLKNTVRMAYAVSGRNNYQSMSLEMQEYIREAVAKFKYIGTRDIVTKRELLKINDTKIYLNCDPVFLASNIFSMTKEEKFNFKKKLGLNNELPVVSIMINDIDIGVKLHRMLKNKYQVLYLYEPNGLIGNNNFVEFSPFEWSNALAVSDVVVTEYFHGTVFSIIHNVPFVALENRQKGRGKIENLLLEHSLLDKMLYLEDYIDNNRQLVMDIYSLLLREVEKVNFIGYKHIKEKEQNKAISFVESLEKEIETLNMKI